MVVVGAGLAGLRAADLLRQAGRQVVVLEARERAGGRVLTIRSPFDDGLHAEAGPIRIAGVHQAVLRTARSLGLTLTPFAPSQGSAVVAIQGTAATAAEVARGALTRDLKPDDHGLDQAALLERYVGTLPGDLAEPAATADSYARWQSYDRVTWPDYLRSRGASPEAIKLMTVGGDATGLSALYVLRQFAMLRRSTQRYKIQGGMDLLPRALASALGNVVRYNAPVVRVTRQSSARQGGGRAPARRFRVEYRANARVESLTASRIIFAIPFTTLRDIEIRPRLSTAKEQAIAQLSYYSVTRFLLQSRQRFWRAADLSGSARTDRATEVWDSTFDQVTSARGILGASVGGSVGRTVLDMTADGQPRVRDRPGRRCLSGHSLAVREGVRPALGPGSLVTRRIPRVQAGRDEYTHADDRPPRKRHPLRGRAHIVVDRMDGGRLAVRRTRRARGAEFMIVVLLIVHGLLAVALLGAITHQAWSVVPPAGGGRDRFPSSAGSGPWTAPRMRPPSSCCSSSPRSAARSCIRSTGSMCGPPSRTCSCARPTASSRSRNISSRSGSGCCPPTGCSGKAPLVPEQAAARRYLTWLLAFVVWWGFLVGHVLNNIKGLLP